MNSPSQPDELLTALRAARPNPGYQPSPTSPEAMALLSRVTAGPRDSERPHLRRLPRRLVLAGIPAVAGAAAIGGIVVATARSAGPSSPVSPTTGTLPGASSVRAAILDAFQRASGDIFATVIRGQLWNGTTYTWRTWQYPMFPQPGQQVMYRLSLDRDGSRLWDSESVYIQWEGKGVPPSSSTKTCIAVDYQDRTWFRGHGTYSLLSLDLSPSQLRDLIAKGTYRVVGTEKLGGHRTLKLEFSSKGYISLFWVGATTYMLMRWSMTSTDRAAKGLGSRKSSTAEYQVLPATQANLALLTTVVPAGFTRVTVAPMVPLITRPAGQAG